MKNALMIFAGLAVCGTASAAPVNYDIDPEHTYPSFEADHMGLSIWRGKFNKTSGKASMDRTAGTGTVDIAIETASIDFGHAKVREYVIGPDQLDAGKYPTTTYKGKLGRFVDGAPTALTGELTLHGVTRPVALTINSFKCIPHPLLKRELCGADAFGIFKRSDFGIDYGKEYGFKPEVTLRIQVEALRTE
ncbi:MAG TPA: YceI family protein [Burkholderiales bacterium]